MISLLPSTSNRLHEVLLRDLLATRKVASRNLRVYLYARVGRNEIVGKVVALENRNPGLHNGVVFPTIKFVSALRRWSKVRDLHVTHGHHVVDLLNTEPVQDVGHESLEAHVFDARDLLRRLEILIGRIATPLAKIVDQVPMDRTKSSMFTLERSGKPTLLLLRERAPPCGSKRQRPLPLFAPSARIPRSRTRDKAYRCKYRNQKRRSHCLRRVR